MPIIVPEDHPLLPKLGSPEAIGLQRALHQGWRPINILIFNMMADKEATERQLAECIGRTPLQVHLTFATTDSYVTKVANGYESENTPSDYIRKFYAPFSAIRCQKFDGLIVTGVNAKHPCVTLEEFYPEIVQLLQWSETNVFSSLFLCWGAMAALKHFHKIDSTPGETKLHGLFEHSITSDKTRLISEWSDVASLPLSRWKRPDLSAIQKCAALEIVALSKEAGANIIVEAAPYDEGLYYPKRVYVNGHPEYPTDELAKEWRRDQDRKPTVIVPLPQNYFTKDNPELPIINRWRKTGDLYKDWVEKVYQATPWRIEDVPQPFSSKSLEYG